jgi:hypothetical protein
VVEEEDDEDDVEEEDDEDDAEEDVVVASEEEDWQGPPLHWGSSFPCDPQPDIVISALVTASPEPKMIICFRRIDVSPRKQG